jgi:transposase
MVARGWASCPCMLLTARKRAKLTWDIDLEIVKRSDQKKFVVLPKRWIVERTLSWLNRYRRLAKDFERFGKTVRNWIFLAMTRLMLKRLGKQYAS